MDLKRLVEYNVKKYREKRGLSQVELSRRINKIDKFIENLENGKYSKALNFETLAMITIELNIRMHDLFINNDDEESDSNE